MKFVVVCIFIVSTVRKGNFSIIESNHMPNEILLNAMCQSFCSHQKSGSSSCYIPDCFCNFNLADFTRLTNASILRPPQLNCKEDDMANFIWDAKYDFVYILEISNQQEIIFTNTTLCNSYTAMELSEDTVYEIRLWAVSFLHKQILYSDALNIKTSKKDSTPEPVTNIYVHNFTLKENTYDAIIKWSPNKDFSCYYDLIWLGEEVESKEIEDPSDLYEVTLADLKFATKYTVTIVAKRANPFYESPKKNFYFVTPSCLDSYSSLDKCPPEIPNGLVINENIIQEITPGGSLICDINLSWSKPKLLPDYYEAHFVSLNPQNPQNTSITSEEYLNITGNQTTAVFKKMELDVLYQVSLMACSSAGCSQKVAEQRHRTDINTITFASTQSWGVAEIVLIVMGILVAILIVTTVVMIINFYRAKQERKEQRYKYFTELEEKLPETVNNLEVALTNQDISDHWEIDPNKLLFQSVLGEGAFGIVRRACLELKDGGKMEVAIKMLKESPTLEEVRQFTQEIEIMKSVKQHPYIVSLIGCITQSRPEGPLLIVEYCSRGDLQTYLRTAWDKFSSMQREIIYIDDSSSGHSNYFANRTYDLHNMNFEDEFIIQPKHLLSIARQVAMGMEHLARTRVVHRDLAARNVLVCENHTVKVSDFGLSRDVYQDNVYCKSGGGKLPIRWMALESLIRQRYTTQSDVWSFGILLWEIVTLGGTPYVGVHSCDLLELLKGGYRLKCPSTCSLELYTIMQNCWKAAPKERPTFSDLCKSLEGLLENVSQYLHLENMDQPLNNDVDKIKFPKLAQNSCSYERYIKPITTLK